LTRLGLSTECIEIDESLPTGTVSVELAADGQPTYLIHEDVAWDAIRGEVPGLRAVAEAHAVCFGSLAQREARSRVSIHTLVAGAARSAFRIFDVNLRQRYYSLKVI